MIELTDKTLKTILNLSIDLRKEWANTSWSNLGNSDLNYKLYDLSLPLFTQENVDILKIFQTFSWNDLLKDKKDHDFSSYSTIPMVKIENNKISIIHDIHVVLLYFLMNSFHDQFKKIKKKMMEHNVREEEQISFNLFIGYYNEVSNNYLYKQVLREEFHEKRSLSKLSEYQKYNFSFIENSLHKIEIR